MSIGMIIFMLIVLYLKWIDLSALHEVSCSSIQPDFRFTRTRLKGSFMPLYCRCRDLNAIWFASRSVQLATTNDTHIVTQDTVIAKSRILIELSLFLDILTRLLDIFLLARFFQATSIGVRCFRKTQWRRSLENILLSSGSTNVWCKTWEHRFVILFHYIVPFSVKRLLYDFTIIKACR